MKDKLRLYIEENLSINTFKRARCAKLDLMEELAVGSSYSSIDNYIDDNKDDNRFQKLLFNYIDNKGLKDSDVYNKVNIDRRLFSKIRSNKDYHPSKETIILFGIALELSENEIEELLSKASYSLPMNNNFDLIIRFCFKEKIYDVNTINEFLYEHNCKLLNE